MREHGEIVITTTQLCSHQILKMHAHLIAAQPAVSVRPEQLVKPRRAHALRVVQGL